MIWNLIEKIIKIIFIYINIVSILENRYEYEHPYWRF